jgi:hypothetical protein
MSRPGHGQRVIARRSGLRRKAARAAGSIFTRVLQAGAIPVEVTTDRARLRDFSMS